MRGNELNFISALKTELSAYGQTSTDWLTNSLFKKPHDEGDKPDLIFLNNETNLGLVIEFKNNAKLQSLPIGYLLKIAEYKDRIESINPGFKYVLISEYQYSGLVEKYFEKIQLTTISKDKKGIGDIIDILLCLTAL